MKQKITIFTIILLSIIFSAITIYAQTSDYPQVIQPLSEQSLQNLTAEFNSLNPNTPCNLDKFGFISCRNIMPPAGGEYISDEDKQQIIDSAKDFLVKNSKFTGVSNKDELIVANYKFLDNSFGSKISFEKQIVDNLIVEETGLDWGIEVRVNSKGLYFVDGHWYLTIEWPEVVLSEEQAKSKLIGKELNYSDFAGKPISYTITKGDLTENAEKVILPLKLPYTSKYDKIEIRLAWKIPVGEDLSWYVYVDAVTGEKLRTQQMFLAADGGPSEKTSNNNLDTLYWMLGILVVIVLIMIILIISKKNKNKI